jgi:hypothetical protein
MQCSFLEGRRILSCRSLGAVYIPSIFELDEYCTQDKHKKCPFFSPSAKKDRFTDALRTDGTKANFS